MSHKRIFYKKKLLLLSICLGMQYLAIVVCSQAETLSEDHHYQAAMQYFNQQQWQKAAQSFQDFQSKFPKSRWKFAVQLRLADLEPNPESAVDMYRGILTRAAKNELTIDARWGLALSYFVLGSYRQTLPLLEKVQPKSRLRQAQALYLSGLSHMALKQYAKSQICFQQVLEKYSDTPWVSPALVGSGETALALKNYAEALTAFDRYLREYPEGDLTPTVLLQKSKALQANGLREESTRTLHELVTRYTESFEAEKAKGKLSEVRENFTIQVGAFSKKEYAWKLVDKLRKQGYNAYVLEAECGNETLTQVRVGSYTTREFSEKIAKQLAKKEKLPYLVLPYVKPDTKGN
ncbi:tetratricopeptide repeat protein [bacterium]|nr:tetratricopeptide repeat protein [bacterium]